MLSVAASDYHYNMPKLCTLIPIASQSTNYSLDIQILQNLHQRSVSAYNKHNKPHHKSKHNEHQFTTQPPPIPTNLQVAQARKQYRRRHAQKRSDQRHQTPEKRHRDRHKHTASQQHHPRKRSAKHPFLETTLKWIHNRLQHQSIFCYRVE